MMKKNIIIILLLQTTIAFGNVDSDVFVDTLEKFEELCIDQNNELREDVYVQDEFFSCNDSLNYLKIEFDKREELMTSNPDVYRQFQDCVENREASKVLPFVEQVQDVADQVTCNEKEKKEFEKDCGKAWECNKLRAIKDGADLLPRIVRNPLQKFVQNTVKAKNYDSECIADGKSNCVKDFVYAFAANLWSSASSVWSLVSKGTKSLFNMGGWFDDEADKLHAKSIQSKKDVEDFWDDPGKWFSNLIDNIKKGVDDWVKTSVFCGKWEGKPQFSKCLQPLENYDCIDCDDRINATCVAIGAISAEVGVAFLTAGVGTAASLTARAGAKTLAVVATKVSSKVKSVSPSFAKHPKLSTTSLAGKTVATIGTGINKSTEVAVKIYSVTSAQALRVKGKIDKLVKSVNEVKVVMVTKAVIAKGNIPARISEKIAEKGVLAGAKLVSKVGRGAVKADADKIIKIAQRAKHSDRAKKVITGKTHEKSRLTGHNAKGTSIVNHGKRKRKSDSDDSGGPSSSSSETTTTNNNSTNNNSVVSQSDNRKHSDRREGQVRSNTESKNTTHSQNQENNKKKQEQLRSQQEQKRVTEQKRREEARKTAETKSNTHSGEKSKQSSSVSKKALAASLAANLSAKGLAVSEEQAQKEAERIDRAANGKGDKFNDNLSSAKKVLGVDNANALSAAALNQAKVVKDMYSDSNRDQIVSEIQKSNSSLSRGEAEQAFNNRQDQVTKAYDYMENLNRENSQSDSSDRIVSAKDELKNLGRDSEINELSSQLSDLAKQREAVEKESSSKSLIDKNSIIPIAENAQPAAPDYSDNRRSDSDDDQIEPSSFNDDSSRGFASSSSSSSPTNNLSNGGDNSSSQSLTEASTETKHPTSEPSIVNNELIEEAIEKSKDLESSLESKELAKKRSKSSDLKNLLNNIGDKPIKVETNITFTRSLDTIKTPTESSKKRFVSLANKVRDAERVEKKYTYALGSGRLELYQYKNESFHLKITPNGVVELIDNKSGTELLNRSALNFE